MMKRHSSDSTGNKSSDSHCSECPIREVGFFCTADQNVMATIDHIKVVMKFKAGETIYQVGSKSTGLYSLRSGIVKLEKNSEDGKSNILNFIGPGGLLGYRSFFTDEIHTSTAKVLEDCEVFFLPGREVNELFDCHPELVHNLVSELAKDAKLAEEKWLSHVNKTASARVAEALLFLEEKFSPKYWSRKNIADWSGTTTETVIRSLSTFEKEGLISNSSEEIKILNHSQLVEKAKV